jgi:hypothetical protein
MILFFFLVSIWSNKIIDYNIINNNNYNKIDDKILDKDIFDSVILCKDISLQSFKNIKNKNIIYTYEEPISSPQAHNFLLTLLASRYNWPILTNKHNYFKPFQYNNNDITLIKIEEFDDSKNRTNCTNEKFIMTKEILKKNSIHFLIENEHNHLFIRV